VDASTAGTGRRRAPAVLGAALVALIASAGACGSGGGTAPSARTHEPPATAATTSEAFARLDPAAFADRMQDKGAVLINVHVPYEGELENTDAFIPYDRIVGDSHLPKDKNTEVLLYCRSGRMSEMAATALHGAGFTRLAHLEGGMRAWEAAGRTIIHNPVHGADATAH